MSEETKAGRKRAGVYTAVKQESSACEECRVDIYVPPAGSGTKHDGG